MQESLLPESDPKPVNPTSAHAPLAERLRPRSLDDVVGQDHLLGERQPLRVAV